MRKICWNLFYIIRFPSNPLQLLPKPEPFLSLTQPNFILCICFFLCFSLRYCCMHTSLLYCCTPPFFFLKKSLLSLFNTLTIFNCFDLFPLLFTNCFLLPVYPLFFFNLSIYINCFSLSSWFILFLFFCYHSLDYRF